MFSDVSSLWNSANHAFKNIGENLSNALENLEENFEDMENSQLSESEIYKKLLDDAQMEHFELSKQVRVLVAEKDAEVSMWKKKFKALNGEEDVVDEEKDKDRGRHEDISTMSTEEKDFFLQKTLAEMAVLKTCVQEVEAALKISLHEKNEAAALQAKNMTLEKEVKVLSSRLKEDNDESHANIQNKSDEIDDLVTEYSKLASESERQKSSDSQRIREVELENEVLTMRMQALEHSLTELADRSTGGSSAGSGSAHASNSPGSGAGSNELKDLKARVVHLEYDIKSKEETIESLKQARQQEQAAVALEGSSSSSVEELQALQRDLARRVEEVANLEQDVSRLQIEKKEAETAGKSFFEQYKELKKSVKANESSLLAEMEQDLSAAQVECTQSREGAMKLKEQVASLQAELASQASRSSAAREGSDESQGALLRVQAELVSSSAEVAELRGLLEGRQAELAEARAAAEALQQDMKRVEQESAQMSASLNAEQGLLKSAQEEVSRLQQELTEQRAQAASQLLAAKEDALMATSAAVDEVKKQLEVEVQQAAERLQQVLAEQAEAREHAAREGGSVVQALQDGNTALKAEVEALEREVLTLRAEVAAKEQQALVTAQAHAAVLLEREAECREAGEKQAADQVAAAVAEAQEFAASTLQASLAEQLTTIRLQSAEQEAAALKAQADQLACEMQAVLDVRDSQHQQATSALRQQLQVASEEALSSQRQELEASKTEALAALEALRAQDKQKAELAAAQTLASHQEEVSALQATEAAIRLELASIEETNRQKTEAAIAKFRVESEENLAQAVAAIRREMQSAVDVAEAAREEYLQLYTKESKARKAVHNKLMDLQGNIRVVCRVRPILEVERKQAKGGDVDATEILSDEDIVIHRDSSTKNRFEFDRVFAPGGTQAEVFASVQPLIVSVLDGYNVCIFAYGQTGSGKTFTMEGYGDASEDKGVSPRAIADLFSFIADAADNWAYSVKFSMLEIYNETIRDLLVEPAPPSGGKAAEVAKLDIRQTATGNVVAGLTEVVVIQPEEVLGLMIRGQKNRAVGAHDMNEHSSRSHSILTLTVSGENNKDGATTCGKLHLIDLAGSERVGKTDATGDRLKEAQNINRSLSALGDVINSLGSKKSSHVPYRNSKLTFLLQDSLGGNSKVLMFVNISPAVYNVSESICSLNFAFRCRNVELGQAKRQVGTSAGGSGSSTSTSTSTSLTSGSTGSSTGSSTSGASSVATPSKPSASSSSAGASTASSLRRSTATGPTASSLKK